jgi:hypothetical protein
MLPSISPRGGGAATPVAASALSTTTTINPSSDSNDDADDNDDDDGETIGPLSGSASSLPALLASPKEGACSNDSNTTVHATTSIKRNSFFGYSGAIKPRGNYSKAGAEVEKKPAATKTDHRSLLAELAALAPARADDGNEDYDDDENYNDDDGNDRGLKLYKRASADVLAQNNAATDLLVQNLQKTMSDNEKAKDESYLAGITNMSDAHKRLSNGDKSGVVNDAESAARMRTTLFKARLENKSIVGDMILVKDGGSPVKSSNAGTKKIQFSSSNGGSSENGGLSKSVPGGFGKLKTGGASPSGRKGSSSKAHSIRRMSSANIESGKL